ncbi:hypothetical protein Nepgr_008899 [Nepenthes gracilis]|uniref:HMG box domain-containing protein n=1 Tax=Nepenthes gracilis TaxID=150966 RepID=A0AAD3SAG2_NEPGR|nr:hypothetical protein Nepgr_008899 [Nepenthes gracilis]
MCRKTKNERKNINTPEPPSCPKQHRLAENQASLVPLLSVAALDLVGHRTREFEKAETRTARLLPSIRAFGSLLIFTLRFGSSELHTFLPQQSLPTLVREMAGGSSKSNVAQSRKRVEADTPATLKRAKNGSAFARCEECNSSVPVALVDFHSCSLEARIKMNLEAQIVEKPADHKKPAELKKKPVDRKKATPSSPESKPKKRRLSKIEDPNKPKRPATAFFLFMEDFRKVYKEQHPDSKKGSEVAKEGGEKWKSMTDEEKKQYVDRAAALKAEYEKAMEAYGAENSNDSVDNQVVEKTNNQPEELCDEDVCATW